MGDTPGSKVMLSIIPDPYLGLLNRSDLTFRELVIVPINQEQEWRYISEADYVITRPQGKDFVVSPSDTVLRFAQTKGRLVTVIGESPDQLYFAQVFKVAK